MTTFFADAGTIWHREMIRFVRRPARVAGGLITPLLWMALFGYGMQRSLGVELPFPGFPGTYLDWTAPGIVAMGMLFSGMFTGMAVVFDRQFGLLREILVAPVSRASFVLGKGLGGMTTSLLPAVVMLAIAVLAFRIEITGPYTVPGAALLATGFLALFGLGIVNLGVAIAARMESHELFMVLVNFLVMPMFFLSGAIYPTQELPAGLRAAVAVNPLHYAVDGVRHALYGAVAAEEPLWLDVTVLLVFGLATTLLAARLFRRA